MKKILVVDDEEKIRSIIRKYGEFEGYEVSEACDGMDAIEKVKANGDYDVIIMDVMMPELDGFSACSEIKKIKDIPVLCFLQEARNMIEFMASRQVLTIM